MQDIVFNFDSETEHENDERTTDDERSLTNDLSEETNLIENTHYGIPEKPVGVKLENSKRKDLSNQNMNSELEILESRCQAAALRSFKAFSERNQLKKKTKKSMDLLISDATEHILTFENTLIYADDHLKSLWQKGATELELLKKSLATHNDVAMEMINIQNYKKEEFEKLKAKMKGIFSKELMPEIISRKLSNATQKFLLQKNLLAQLIVLPLCRNQLQRDKNCVVMNETPQELLNCWLTTVNYC